jgi:formiminotetrahydrofolate cyclodeaminase
MSGQTGSTDATAATGAPVGSDQPYVQWPIESYLERLASDAPEPGGGSVAALVGALGAALVSMVANLTLGKEKYTDAQDLMVGLKERAEKLRVELEELVTLDAQAYGAVAAAMKLPQEGEAQKRERKTVLQAALKEAASVPEKVALAAVEVARLSLPAAEKGNLYAVSDAGVAALLADAAAQAAALNVKINLTWIEDKEFTRAVWTRIEAALSEAARVRDIVLAMTYGKL